MAEKYQLASAGSDIKIWELPGLSLLGSINQHSQVTSICWSSNNQNLASVGADKIVVTYTKGGMNTSTDFAVGDGHTCAAFNSTSRYLLVGGKTKMLSVWDLKSKSVKKTYKGHKDTISCLQFNWNDTSIASGSVDGSILLHNVVTGQASQPLRQPKTQAIRGLEYSHFKKSLLASVSDDGALNMWDTNARKLLMSFTNEHKAPATALSFSPVNEMLLTSVGLDKKIVFYDVQGKKSVKVMIAEAPLTAVDFLHDGVTLAVGTTRGKVCIYDLRSGSTPVSVQAAHMSSVQCLRFQNPPSNKNASLPTNKVTKSATSVNPLKMGRTQPQSQPEEPQKSASHNSTTTARDLSAARAMTSQHNGIKEEEVEIFSPIREAKPSASSLIKTDDIRLVVDRDLAVNGKDSRPVDSSGIFSPLASNTSVADSRHRPVGGPAYSPTDRPTTSSSSQLNGPAYSPTDRQPHAGAEPAPSSIQQTTITHTNSRGEAAGQGRTATQLLDTSSGSRPGLESNSTGSRPGLASNPSGSRPGLTSNSSASSGKASELSSTGSDLSGSNPRLWSEADLVRGDDRPDMLAASEMSVGEARFHGASGSFPEGLQNRSPHESPYLPRKFSSSSSAEAGEGSAVAPDGPDILRNSTGQTNGHAHSAAAGLQSSGAAGLQPFQVEFIKNMIDDSMDEFRVAIHRDVVNLQVEMLRQFHIQQRELREMMEKYSVNEALVAEIERLREENRRLKTKY